MSSLSAPVAVLRRDLLRALRRRQDFAQAILFFVLVVTAMAVAIGPESESFVRLAPAAVWFAVLLATTLNLDSLFLDDYRNGLIEQLILSPTGLASLVGAKILAHWLSTAVPQIIVACIVAFVMGVPGKVVAILAASLLLGSPILSCIGAISGALTMGLRGGAMLIALISLPLYLPTVIFGTVAVHNAQLGGPAVAELYFLAGLAVLASSLAPFAAAAALKIRCA